MRGAGLILLCIFISSQASGQNLDEQERLNALQRALGAVEELRGMADRLTKAKKLECITAIAHEPLCECLTQNLPVPISFVNYVTIVTQSKEDLQYSKLSPDDKQMVDNTRTARDKCVREESD